MPYLLATWVMALATPECTAPIRKPHCSWAMKRSATRVPVAGLVSVSAVIHSTLRPSTPPLALNSSIAMRMPRTSSWPLLPYWPLASQVRPSLIGFLAPCAQTRLCCHGPKKVAVPPSAAAIRLPLTSAATRRCGAASSFPPPGSAVRLFDGGSLLGHRINILYVRVK